MDILPQYIDCICTAMGNKRRLEIYTSMDSLLEHFKQNVIPDLYPDNKFPMLWKNEGSRIRREFTIVWKTYAEMTPDWKRTEEIWITVLLDIKKSMAICIVSCSTVRGIFQRDLPVDGILKPENKEITYVKQVRNKIRIRL